MFGGAAPTYLAHFGDPAERVSAGAAAVDFIKSNLEVLVAEGLEKCLTARPQDAVHFLAQFLKDANPNRKRVVRKVTCKVERPPLVQLQSGNNKLAGDLNSPTAVLLSASDASFGPSGSDVNVDSRSCSPAASPLEAAVAAHEDVSVELVHVSRSVAVKERSFSQLGPHPIFTVYSPTTADVEAIVQAIARTLEGAVATPPQTSLAGGVSSSVAVLVLQNSEVLYLDDGCGYVGSLAHVLATHRPGAASRADIVAEATEAVLEAVLETPSIRGCATVADAFANAARRVGANMQFAVRPVIGFPAELSFADLNLVESVLRDASADISAGSNWRPGANRPVPTVVVTFDPQLERVLTPLAMLPLMVHHCCDEHARLSRLQRAAAELRAVEAMRAAQRGLGVQPTSKASEMSATARAMLLHDKLRRRRAERKVARAKRLEGMGEIEHDVAQLVERAEAARAQRHDAEERAFRSAVHRVQGIAACKIQSLLRGFIARKKHAVFTKQHAVDCETLFETTFATTVAFTGKNTATPNQTVSGASPIASQGSGLLDGEFALLRLTSHAIAELDGSLFSLERPPKPRPPRAYTVVRQRTRRVPALYDGDISSEEEEVTHEVVGTKPQPLTARQLQVNPVYHVHRCMEAAGCEEQLRFVREAATIHRGVHAIQRRAFRAVEQFAVWTALVAYTSLALRGRIDPLVVGFGAWVKHDISRVVSAFGHPQLYATATTQGLVAYVDSHGPRTADAGLALVAPHSMPPSAGESRELPGTSLLRIRDGLFVSLAPLSLSEWKSALQAAIHEERASAVVWAHCARHPTIYVGESMYLVCAVGHETQRRRYGATTASSPKALQFCNAEVAATVPATSTAASTAATAGIKRRSSGTSKSSSNGSVSGVASPTSAAEPAVMRPYPPQANTSQVRRRGSQTTFAAPVSTEASPSGPHHEVVFARPPSPSCAELVRHVDPLFPTHSVVLALDWLEWERQLCAATVAQIDRADGILSRFVWRAVGSSTAAGAVELIADEVRVVKPKVKAAQPQAADAAAATLPPRVVRTMSVRRESLASLDSASQTPTAGVRAGIGSGASFSIQDDGTSADGQQGPRRRGQRKTTRLSSRMSRTSRAPSESGCGGDDAATVGNGLADRGDSLAALLQQAESDPNVLLPDAAKRTVRDFGTAASEVIRDVIDAVERAATPSLDGSNMGSHARLHTASSTAAAAAAAAPSSGRVFYVRAPIVAISANLAYEMLDNAARLARDVFTQASAPLYGDAPLLVLSSPVVFAAMELQHQALFVAAVAVVTDILKPPSAPAQRHTAADLKGEAPQFVPQPPSGAGDHPLRVATRPPRRPSTHSISAASAIAEEEHHVGAAATAVDLGTSVMNTVSVQLSSPPADSSLLVPMTAAVGGALQPAMTPDGSSVAPEVPLPGALGLLRLLDALDVVIDELVPQTTALRGSEPDPVPASGAMRLHAFVADVVRRLPAPFCDLLQPARIWTLLMQAADISSSTAQRASNAVAAALCWEQRVLLLLFAAFYISPVTCSFAEFVEGNPALKAFVEDTDLFALCGIPVEPWVRRYAHRGQRWRFHDAVETAVC